MKLEKIRKQDFWSVEKPRNNPAMKKYIQEYKKLKEEYKKTVRKNMEEIKMKTLVDLLLDTGAYTLTDFYVGNVDCDESFNRIISEVHDKEHIKEFVKWLINDTLNYTFRFDWESILADYLKEKDEHYINDENRNPIDYKINEDFELSEDDCNKLNLIITNYVKDSTKNKFQLDLLIARCVKDIRYLEEYGEQMFIIEHIKIQEYPLENILFNYIRENYSNAITIYANDSLETMSREALIEKVRELENKLSIATLENNKSEESEEKDEELKELHLFQANLYYDNGNDEIMYIIHETEKKAREKFTKDTSDYSPFEFDFFELEVSKWQEAIDEVLENECVESMEELYEKWGTMPFEE